MGKVDTKLTATVKINGKLVPLYFGAEQRILFDLLIDNDGDHPDTASVIMSNIALWLSAAAHAHPDAKKEILPRKHEYEIWWYLQATDEDRRQIFRAMNYAEIETIKSYETISLS